MLTHVDTLKNLDLVSIMHISQPQKPTSILRLQCLLMGVWLETVGRILAEAFTSTNDVELHCIIMSTCIKSTHDCHDLQWNQKQAPPKVLGFSWRMHYIRTGSDPPKVIATAIYFI